MSNSDPKKISELPKAPNVVYVVDTHGDGWFCTEDSEDISELSGECVHEEEVDYDRSFGG